jgi:hypothetical protein
MGLTTSKLNSWLSSQGRKWKKFVFWRFCLLSFLLKGTVRRDARWVGNGLKQCVLTNYITASLSFWVLKWHHHENSIKPVSASKQQLNWICRLNWQCPANDVLHTFNSIDLSLSHELQATSFKLRAASCELQATSYKLQVQLQNTRYELRAKRYEI